VFKPDFKNHLMVATVTGIAPYVSMLRAHFYKPSGDYQFHVLEGASYRDEFAYDDELGRYAQKHSFVHFLPSVSRPADVRNSGWAGATGRINTLIEGYIRDNGLKPADTCVYACGHPQMIENVRERIDGTGFHFEEERFWKDDE
jgi:NAD(P)H-flavin reductase